MAYELKPFYLNANDISYLLAQINFHPMFDAAGNAVVAWDGTSPVLDAQGNAYDLTGLSQQQAWDAYGHGFPSVSAPIGIRDVTGFHNNLYGTQAQWGTVGEAFVRLVPADYGNYITTPGANYADHSAGNEVIDMMPRIISRTITTGGVNLLKDVNGHFVTFDLALYNSSSTYKLFIDGAVGAANVVNLVDGAKVVAPLSTQVAVLDGNGDPLVWHQTDYQLSGAYATLI